MHQQRNEGGHVEKRVGDGPQLPRRLLCVSLVVKNKAGQEHGARRTAAAARAVLP
jgi:hypothetical protein